MWKEGLYAQILFYLMIQILACERENLQMVQIVTKHCNMAPPFLYPNDPNSESVWLEGLNDLTMLGKFQAYALGVFLRNFYSDFISSDPRELEVISSIDKGVAKSAQSLVTALYSPNAYWEVVQNFPWQPIYIKYDTKDGEFLKESTCPSATAELKRVKSRETPALLQTYQNLMHYWSMNSGMNLKCVIDVEKLYEILLTELTHNLTIPEWSQTYWNEMKYIHDVSLSLKTKTTKLIKLQGGLLIDKILSTMREKAINAQDPRKVVVYSSHTEPLQALLKALDFNDFEYLPPCSSLLMELYKQEEEYFLRFLFLNSTAPQREPQKIYSLSMTGCMEFCPLDYVIDYTKDCIIKNREQECFPID